MTVVAKFKVQRLEISIDHNKELLTTVVMNPVFGVVDDPTNENSKFFRWTPSGEIRLGVLNPKAASYFEIGENYYLEFTHAKN